jgi:type II protein arginine methyltransferase
MRVINAARAGARSVISCEMVSAIAERARDIIALNGLSRDITVIDKPSSELAVGRGLAERAQVLVTEVFSSSLIREGVLPTIEHAHKQLLTDDAVIIPYAASAMGYLIGGTVVEGMLFARQSNGFDVSPFDDFAPLSIYAALDGIPHNVLSGDFELLRFNLRMKTFPVESRRVSVAATRAGICAGVAQWIRLELDEYTRYENKPASAMDSVSRYPCGWTHVLYRFPKPMPIESGDVLTLLVTHDRRHFAVELA